jgi:hypothetical protein
MEYAPPVQPIERSPTAREAELLHAVDAYTLSKGYPPTIADVAIMIGLSHTRTACLARSCVRRGWLAHERRVARSWRVVR